MQPMPHTEFIKQIVQEVNDGWGFVPLIGSGLSAISGIPTGREIGRYLNACIVKALSPDADKHYLWKPRSCSWPPPDELEKSTVDIAEFANRQVKKTTRLWDKGRSTGFSALMLEAVGALANWRTALQFLSRLEYLGEQPSLGAPDDRVVDSYFVHVTRGRSPNDAQMMLAHLAGALRIHTVLTTNFDDLVEQAFAELNMPLVPFDVHVTAGLPDARLVSAQRAIVKLHGGRYGLRADFSLDEIPSDADKKTFRDYLASRDAREEEKGKVVGNRHILALGTAGADLRTRTLLSHAMRHMPDMRLWWVCHSEGGAARVVDLLTADSRSRSPADSDRVAVTVHSDLEAFLFELYQELYLSLPPAGADYPAFWRVPPLPYGRVKQDVCNRQRDYLRKKIGRVLDGWKDRAKAGVSRVLEFDGGPGLSSVAADVCKGLSSENHCLWLELDDFSDPEDLFLTLADLMARKTGLGRPMPLLLTKNDAWYKATLKRCLAEYAKESLRPIVVFLNLRDGLGQDTGYDLTDDPSPVRWERDRIRLFWDCLDEVSQPWILFVTLCRRDRGVRGRNRSMPAVLAPASLEFNADDVVKGVLEWLRRERPEARRFTYAMTLCRHSRHLSALSTWAFLYAPRQCRTDGGDNDVERGEAAREWLRELVAKRAIRVKPGGFAWMHTEVRNRLRDKLADCEFPGDGNGIPLRKMRAECHQGIADWYMKLFRSTNDPLAATESLYHRMSCASYAKDLPPEPVGRCGAPDYVRNTAFVEAEATLRLARRRILSLGHFSVFSRLLEGLVKQPLVARSSAAQARSLRALCEEILRDFAKEVADFESLQKHNNEVLRLRRAWPRAGDAAGTSPSDAARKLYFGAVSMMGMRCYGEAQTRFHKLFRHLGVEGTLIQRASGNRAKDWPLSELGVAGMRSVGRMWLQNVEHSQEEMGLLIHALRRYMFLQVLVAQMCLTVPDMDRADERLVYAERIYVLATELLRSYTAVDDLLMLNVHLRTDYAVMLAMVGRFHEASRRLNEATGYLSQIPGGADTVVPSTADPIAASIIDMRRAEAHLFRIQRHKANNTDPRQTVALLDSMYHALGRARRGLAGRRKSVWWWTYYCDLRLSTCVQAAAIGCCKYRQSALLVPLCCRGCLSAGDQCVNALREGMGLVHADVLRQAKLTELMASFLDHIDADRKRAGKDVWKAFKEACTHLDNVCRERTRQWGKFEIAPQIDKYQKNVRAQADEMLRRKWPAAAHVRQPATGS